MYTYSLNQIFRIIIFAFLLCHVPTKSFAGARHNQEISKFSASVISCHDGDTCKVEVKGQTVKIRLAGIDAPEIEQPEGVDAKKFLESKVLKKTIEFDCKGKSYDRIVCLLKIDGLDINEEMVRNGYAFDYKKFSQGKYQTLMKTAQRKKIGIWKTLQKSPFCTRHPETKTCLSNPFFNQ